MGRHHDQEVVWYNHQSAYSAKERARGKRVQPDAGECDHPHRGPPRVGPGRHVGSTVQREESVPRHRNKAAPPAPHAEGVSGGESVRQEGGVGTHAMPGAHGGVSPKMELTEQGAPRAPGRGSRGAAGRLCGAGGCVRTARQGRGQVWPSR